MSMDPIPVYIAAQQWKDAEHLHLPRTEIEPVIWVTGDDRLCMYHPAMALTLNVPPQHWDAANFRTFVAEMLPDASAIVEKNLAKTGMPGCFYSEFPEHARAGMKQ